MAGSYLHLQMTYQVIHLSFGRLLLMEELGIWHVVSDLKMDDLQIARATALRDIFGSSDSGSSSYENLGCENNAISLADEITSLNVVQEQDLNISSHPLPVVGMLFDSVDEFLTMTYQDHAKEKGFR
ncbi:hypothetical protein Syun_010138 [Stephania yunnanensis]|uniref:Uncharacterized protein n=1 Tax=Stephania yunnanensis TaxID=152371 RepID=A0AAP0KI35_9MAGN